MEQQIDLKRYLRAIGRGWWLILALTATTALVAFIASPRSTAAYTTQADSSSLTDIFGERVAYGATTTVVLENRNYQSLTEGENKNSSGQLSVAAYSPFVTRPEVLFVAAQKMYGLEGALLTGSDQRERIIGEVQTEFEQLQKAIEFQVIGESNQIIITSFGPNPKQAIERSNAVAEAFQEFVNGERKRNIADRMDAISRELDALRVVREENLILDTQRLAEVGEDLSKVIGQVSLAQKGLSEIRVSQGYESSYRKSMEVIAGQLEGANSELELAEDQLQLTREVTAGNPEKIAEISSEIKRTLDILNGTIVQLDSVDKEASEEKRVSLQAEIILQAKAQIISASESITTGLDFLSRVPEKNEPVIGPVQKINGSLIAASNSLDLVAENVNLASRTSKAEDKSVRFQLIGNRVAETKRGLNTITSLLEDLEGKTDTVSIQENLQSISNSVDVMHINLSVVLQELRLLRSIEPDATATGYVLTADGFAQQADNALLNIRDQAQLSAESPTRIIKPTTPQDLNEQLESLARRLERIPAEIDEDTLAQDASQRSTLIFNIQELEASLKLIARELNLLLETEQNVNSFGSISLALDRIEIGGGTLDEAVLMIEEIDTDSVRAISSIRNGLTAITSEVEGLLSTLDAQAAESETVSVEQSQRPASQKVGELSASLEGLAQQMLILRRTERDPIAFGAFLVSEERIQKAADKMQLLETQIDKLDQSGTSQFQEQLGEFQSRIEDVSSYLDEIRSMQNGFQQKISAGEAIDTSSLISLRTQISSANAILQPMIGQAESLRIGESDVNLYAGILALEDRLKGTSSNLSLAWDEISNLALSDHDSVWLNFALDSTTESIDLLDNSASRIAAIGQSNSNTAGPRPADLSATGTNIRDAIDLLELASSQIARAQQENSEPGLISELISVDNWLESSRALLSSAASQFTEIIEPLPAESRLSSQLISSQRQLQLEQLLTDNALTIVAPAVSAYRIEDSGVQTNTILGAAAGLVLSLLFVLLRGHLDQTVRTVEDIRDVLRRPVIGTVPKVRGKWGSVPAINPVFPSPFSDAMRLIRANTDLSYNEGSSMALLVTSPYAAEGKSTIAINLARSMALEKKRVLLIDANLRKPEVKSAFNLNGVRGIGAALANGHDPLDYITNVEGIGILAADEEILNPSDVMTSNRLRGLIVQAKQHYDFIVIDGPPVVGFAETVSIARNVDEVLLVVHANRTTKEMVEQSYEILDSAGARVRGIVLNMVSNRDFGRIPHRIYRRNIQKSEGSKVEQEQT